MGLVSQRVSRSDLEAGDHIYTWRTAFTYSHHGIYVGENKVVHFTHFSSSSSNTRATCLDIPDCGFKKDGSGVIMSCLNCFLGDGSLYRFEYGVSTPTFIARFRGGTCTTANPDPSETVVHRAMYLLHKGFGNYDLFTNNCEDFALYCKTGRLVRRSKKREAPMGCSGQATSFVGVPLAAVIALPLQMIFSGPVVFAASTAATYSFNRYSTDIGVRGDVVEVRVEGLELFHGDESTQPGN
ncbi:hypothetical protein PHJA_001501900 [Phtheirospermum japonicum]|uniref:LRAT domain-containing protein n=1 Tax=Phtheirospermum japonicum TaxID=374723 RepID=A0A830CEC2_9LAMI|nr:hypothetical protein PHJA_001501900 [Phtheirospermum japonicum]